MDPKYSPVYILRAYTWWLLQNNLGMSTQQYGGLVPVVPVAEEPELTQFNKPYIVYGYALGGAGELYARRTGSMSMVVYSTRFGEITQILNVLSEGLGRQDESARDINAFSSTVPHFLGLHFGHVSLGFVEGGAPESPGDRAADTEGGRQSGLINVNFEYYVNYNVTTSSPSWG